MGRGNVRVTGQYEGLYYIDNDDLICFRPKDGPAVGDDEHRLLRDVPADQMDEWEYDDITTEWWQGDVEEELKAAIRKRFPSFKDADDWISGTQRAILENNLYYVVLEDNEWSLAVELIQKEDPYSERLRGLQAGLYQKYLDGLREALFEQFEKLHIRTSALTSGTIRREDQKGADEA